jgi:hypothetical protein
VSGAESHVRQDRVPDLVARLRHAAALLRAVDHDHPRGPWRAAAPEPTGPPEDRDGVDDVLGVAHSPWSAAHSADPLAGFEDLVGHTRPRFASPTVHRPAVDPSLAGPLATLLDAVADLAVTTLAERVDDDGAGLPATEPYRSAMAVAERVCAEAS